MDDPPSAVGGAARVFADGPDPLSASHPPLALLCLPVKVPLALGVLLDPRLASNPVYGVSTPSLAMVTISTGEPRCGLMQQVCSQLAAAHALLSSAAAARDAGRVVLY